MLTLVEKIFFIFLILFAGGAALRVADRIRRIVDRGQGSVDWRLVPKRLGDVLAKVLFLQPVWRMRFWTSLFHAFVVWGFTFYLLVNLGDVLEGLIPDFEFLGSNIIGSLYRLGGDLLSVAALFGMLALIIRRQLLKPDGLTIRDSTLLHPKALAGIQRDSLIVGLFILVHVGSRFLGETFEQAHTFSLDGRVDAWQPFAGLVSGLWRGWGLQALVVAEHVAFWGAIGSILVFIPYFLYSKHLHLFMAPVNFVLRPERSAPGQLDALDFEDESIELFGATRLEELSKHQILDAYACIMCNRCQEVCPAYTTGKVLSPAALEINKRYFLNQEGARLAKGEESSQTLLEFAISIEAVWACTACGACTDICPVGNDPMRDILDIRRALVLMENSFPDELQTAYRGMERAANPWNISSTERMKWADGIRVPTLADQPDAEILWWVGCAPATDARVQKVARAFATILNNAGVNYAVLGEQESCTGDSARRSGNEYLFFEMATANVELLNEVAPQRIVTTCPHCLHTIANEYPAFGGHYEVIHHTQLIRELVDKGDLKLEKGDLEKITFHDPCYLGRQNKVLIDPRQLLEEITDQFVELPRRGEKSFCCGAGGGQMWKEEEAGTERVSANRMREAQTTGADTLAVGCPFCLIMLADASNAAGAEMQLQEVAEIIADRLQD
jgi:Fe-S oxidoreductase